MTRGNTAYYSKPFRVNVSVRPKTMDDDELAKEIIDLVSKKTGIAIVNIKSKWRKREVVEARMLCSLLMKNHTRLSLTMIGAKLGGFDHSSVIHHCQTIKDVMDTSRVARELYYNLDATISRRNF